MTPKIVPSASISREPGVRSTEPIAAAGQPPATNGLFPWWLTQREGAPLWLAGAAAAMTVVSIAAFEILLGLAIVALAIERKSLRLPPITWPLGLWFVGTLLSAFASGQATAAWPQIKKFYVYLLLFVVFSAFRKLSEIRGLFWVWAACAALSSAWSLVQFERKYEAAKSAHENFYNAYVGSRITGFMGHWMTFSGHMMMALMLIGALLFFARKSNSDRHEKRHTAYLIAAGLLVTIGLLAAFTRSMWLGAMVGGLYLIWMWHRRLVLAIPVLVGVLLAVNPFALRDRALSAFEPHADVDSNEHRTITRRVGYEMIKAHPWFGLGPEEVGPHFKEYLPADIPLPLPSGYYGHLHNIYVHYAAERGIPTMLALMWMLGQALFDFVRALRRAPKQAGERWVLHGAVAVMLAVLVSGFYELNLGDSEVLGMFLAVVACGYVAVTLLKSTESAPISAAWQAKASNNT